MSRFGLLLRLHSAREHLEKSDPLWCMRRKIRGYILQFTRSDHDGRHIHVFRDNEEIGVFDRVDGPTRGLDQHLGKGLREALDEFIALLDERGF
jgi:hypothetical protein